MLDIPAFTIRLGDLALRPLVSCTPQTSVQDAAREMAAADTGSVVVVDQAGRAIGILTDSDLRKRVVAAGVDTRARLGSVMSSPVVTIASDAVGLQAVQLMLERGIHHLVLVDGSGRARGIVADSDLVSAEAQRPLFLVRRIERAQSVEELAAARASYPATVHLLIEGGANARSVGEILAEANDRLTRRVIELALTELGPPPAPYCWLCMGTEGRRAQTLATDQDNGLVWSADAPAEAAAYFERLARRVVDDLERTGAPRCRGDVMATNPIWRGSIASWRERFDRWIAEPRPRELLNALIAFDFRGVAGDLGLADGLRSWLLPRVAGAKRLLAHIAADAVEQRPPLGPFGNVALEPRGPARGSFDAKRAVAPVINGARLLALEREIPATSTTERLEGARLAGVIPEEDARDMSAGYLFVRMLRLRGQLASIDRAEPPGNRVYPGELVHADRAALREHLHAIDRFRRAIEQDRAMLLRGM